MTKSLFALTSCLRASQLFRVSDSSLFELNLHAKHSVIVIRSNCSGSFVRRRQQKETNLSYRIEEMWMEKGSFSPPSPRRLRIRLSGGRRRRKIDNLSQICFSNFHVAPIVISANLLSVDGHIGGARPEIRFNIVRKAESQCLTSNVMVAEFLRNFHSIFLSVPTTFHDIFPLKMNPSNVQQVTSPFFISPLKRLEVFATRKPRAVLAHPKICCKLKIFLLSAAADAPHPTPPPCQKPN